MAQSSGLPRIGTLRFISDIVCALFALVRVESVDVIKWDGARETADKSSGNWGGRKILAGQ